MVPEVWAILVAAGASSRAGSAVPKQFVRLSEHPTYLWGLHAMTSAGAAGVVVVVPVNEVARVGREVRLMKNVVVVAGGARRRDSVAQGLRAVPSSVNLVLVHDAARPFIPTSLPRRVVASCMEGGVALPALPVPDTIKRSDTGRLVMETVDRRGLFLAQTPQACRRDVLTRIVELAPDVDFTDEAHGAEHLGLTPHLVTGSPYAFKITTAADLSLAHSVAFWLTHVWRDHADWNWVRYTSAG